MSEVPQPSRLPDGRLLLHLTEQSSGIVLGRSEVGGDFVPDLDLAPFDGQNAGVSRRHAALVQYNERLHLVDLDSANGTFVNSRRVPPNQPVRLKDNDAVRLGSLILLIRVVTE
ncbi:MAG: FHA domain-containing protein [Anaerolineae bacterium]